MEKQKYCLKCMERLWEGGTCGCGFEPGGDYKTPGRLEPGTVLNGRYLIGLALGAGGFGVTYIGRDLTLDIKVAVKECSSTMEKEKEQFLKEARTLARFLDDPGIVKVRDIFEAGGTAYLVMEYIDGMTLREYVEKNGPMEEKQMLRYMEPVMDSLIKIHKEGLIHRDISADNIMLTGGNQVRLLDFGAARDVGGEGQQTVTVMLKKGYTPEEQYRGRSYQGPWSDVYALCATMYKCITGQTPTDCLQRIFHDDLKNPSEFGISSGLGDVLMRGMAVLKENRIQSVEELRAELGMAVKERMESVPVPEKVSVKESKIPAVQPKVSAEPAKPVKEPARLVEPAKPVKEKARLVEPAKPEEPARLKIRKKPKKNVISLILLLCIAVVGLGIIGGQMYRDNPYYTGNGSSDLREVTVTKNMIKSIKRHGETKYLSIINCVLDDDAVAQIALLDSVERIYLLNCTGYQSLAPWADMSSLRAIDISIIGSQRAGFDGTSAFPVPFENVKELSIDVDALVGNGDFMKNFPAMEKLHLDKMEGVEDLEFLRSMPELKNLIITYWKGRSFEEMDLSAIGACRKLERIIFLGTYVGDLSFCSSLENLKDLQAPEAGITDITPLAQCTKLGTVQLSENRIADLSALADKTELYTLELQDNQIKDITPLEQSVKLHDLKLSNNQIEDISVISNFLNLNRLELAGNQITDISPISGCTGIRFLSLQGNQIENLDACQRMIDLMSIDAGDNQIADISGIRNSSALKRILLKNNKIGDISALSNHFDQLTLLDISQNQVSDIQALQPCVSLNTLQAEHNRITSLEPLSGLTKLILVYAGHNQLTDLKGLENKTDLTGLRACDNEISDISALASCEKLQYIDLGKNRIQDIAPLKALTASPAVLLLESNEISDISMLPINIKYSMLSLYENSIKDFSILPQMTGISSGDVLYVSYQEEMDYNQIASSKFGNKINMVDAPLEVHAHLNKIREENNKGVTENPHFLTKEEADAELAEHRKLIAEEGEEGEDG